MHGSQRLGRSSVVLVTPLGRRDFGRVEHVKSHLLAADLDSVAVTQVPLAIDTFAVDEHAVSAAEILDRHALLANAKRGVLARHERIVERELTLRAAPYAELPHRQLEIVREIPETVEHRYFSAPS